MKELICITCPRGCRLSVDDNLNVTGNFCPRGAIYAKNELTHPVRVLTTTVKTDSQKFPRVPVKTSDAMPKELIFKAMEVIDGVTVKLPVKIGDIIVKNLLNCGVDVVATKNVEK